MSVRLSIVIPTRNRQAHLLRMLEALDLEDASARPFELVVADDGSADDTPRLLERESSRRSFPIRTIRLEGRGPATARNAGIALAAADRVLLLGDDTFPRPETLGLHLPDASRGELGIQGRIDWHPEEEITPLMRFLAPSGPQFYFTGLTDGSRIPYTAILGSNLSAPTRWFREEPFDENFPAAAFEDTESGYRWARRGWNVVFSEQAACWHSHPYFELGPFLERQRRAGAAARYAVGKHPRMFARNILQPFVAGAVRAVRARLRGPLRNEDRWEIETRKAFFDGFLRGGSGR